MAVFMPLETWLDFLEAYAEQVKHMLGQAPEELQRATLGTAGTALTTLRSLGMDHTACKQLVVEGMPVVKRIEVCGSRGGKPNKKVQVMDCGQLPGRLEVLKRIQLEKEEAAANRANPLQLDVDAEARKRLAELKAQLQSKAGEPAVLEQLELEPDAATAGGVMQGGRVSW
ncbi:PPIase cyclophilin-type domain-containing protein, partial [Haematococcus lacustris]